MLFPFYRQSQLAAIYSLDISISHQTPNMTHWFLDEDCLIQEREINSQNMAKTDLDNWCYYQMEESICPRESFQKLVSTMQLVSFYFIQKPSPGCISVHWEPDVCKFSALLGASNCVEEVCISFSVHCLVSQLLLTATLCHTSQVLV